MAGGFFAGFTEQQQDALNQVYAGNIDYTLKFYVYMKSDVAIEAENVRFKISGLDSDMSYKVSTLSCVLPRLSELRYHNVLSNQRNGYFQLVPVVEFYVLDADGNRIPAVEGEGYQTQRVELLRSSEFVITELEVISESSYAGYLYRDVRIDFVYAPCRVNREILFCPQTVYDFGASGSAVTRFMGLSHACKKSYSMTKYEDTALGFPYLSLERLPVYLSDFNNQVTDVQLDSNVMYGSATDIQNSTYCFKSGKYTPLTLLSKAGIISAKSGGSLTSNYVLLPKYYDAGGGGQICIYLQKFPLTTTSLNPKQSFTYPDSLEEQLYRTTYTFNYTKFVNAWSVWTKLMQETQKAFISLDFSSEGGLEVPCLLESNLDLSYDNFEDLKTRWSGANLGQYITQSPDEVLIITATFENTFRQVYEFDGSQTDSTVNIDKSSITAAFLDKGPIKAVTIKGMPFTNAGTVISEMIKDSNITTSDIVRNCTVNTSVYAHSSLDSAVLRYYSKFLGKITFTDVWYMGLNVYDVVTVIYDSYYVPAPTASDTDPIGATKTLRATIMLIDIDGNGDTLTAQYMGLIISRELVQTA